MSKDIQNALEIDWDNLDLDDILWIESIEYEFWETKSIKEIVSNLEYKIKLEWEGLSIYTYEEEHIWYIQKWHFSDSLNNIDSENHLEKYVNESFRWKWYWVALMNEYINSWFELPPEEYTSDLQVIWLMEKFWYHVVSYYDGWDEVFVDWNNFDFNEDQIYRMERINI